MENLNQNYLDSLKDIRSMMDRSSRFISLSGLAGVAAGFWALIGSSLAYFVMKGHNYPFIYTRSEGESLLIKLFSIALMVLFLAVTSGIFFTTRKAKQQGQTVWDKKVWQLLYNSGVPLVTGGIFCLLLMNYNLFTLVAPCTLIFYGIALFCAGNYTHTEVKSLGIVEILLGFTNLIVLQKPYLSLAIWAFGFGVMHIIYGVLMYKKYEKNEVK